MSDMVNHPPHYASRDGSGIECIDFIHAGLTYEEFRGYLKGCMMKYVFRSGFKNDAVEDLEKMEWYANRLIDHLKEGGGEG